MQRSIPQVRSSPAVTSDVQGGRDCRIGSSSKDDSLRRRIFFVAHASQSDAKSNPGGDVMTRSFLCLAGRQWAPRVRGNTMDKSMLSKVIKGDR